MKHIIIAIILGIILGIFVDYKFVRHYYNKEEITDSIKHDTVNIFIDSIIKDTVIPNEIIKSIKDVNIDTINTIINGKVIESNYKITILK